MFTPRILAAFAASLLSASSLSAAESTLPAGFKTLLNQTFNTPTELTYNFPPLKGESWRSPIATDVSVNTNDGQTKVIYGDGLGANNTGGLYVEVVKPATVFMQLNYDKITFTTGDPASLTLAQIRTQQVRFDAKIPAGAKVLVYLMMVGPKDLRQRTWASRLEFGTVEGTGDYKSYVLSASDLPATDGEPLLRLMQDYGLNQGAREIKVGLIWKLQPLDPWTAGAGFQLDNILYGFAPTSGK